jgi:hypothetical protein
MTAGYKITMIHQRNKPFMAEEAPEVERIDSNRTNRTNVERNNKQTPKTDRTLNQKKILSCADRSRMHIKEAITKININGIVAVNNALTYFAAKYSVRDTDWQKSF